MSGRCSWAGLSCACGWLCTMSWEVLLLVALQHRLLRAVAGRVRGGYSGSAFPEELWNFV
jgi:hypothetical protein